MPAHTYFFSDKGSVFLKNRHFIIQERFYKLIYHINTIVTYFVPTWLYETNNEIWMMMGYEIYILIFLWATLPID